MDKEKEETGEDLETTDKVFLRNLIIAKVVVLLVILAVVGLVFQFV